jgi:hypothetical protein
MTRRTPPDAESLRQQAAGIRVANQMLAEWVALRREIAALERAEHPDIVDRHGRSWAWGGRGDLYSHDRTLAVPVDWITESNLPPETLADNWNYWRLCAVCTSGWSAAALAKHAQNAVDIADYQRLGWDGYQKLRGTS